MISAAATGAFFSVRAAVPARPPRHPRPLRVPTGVRHRAPYLAPTIPGSSSSQHPEILQRSLPIVLLRCAGLGQEPLAVGVSRGEEAGEGCVAKYLCAKCSFSGLTVFSADTYLVGKKARSSCSYRLMSSVGSGSWGQAGVCVVFWGSHKKDVVGFTGSRWQTRLEHDRLPGSVPVCSRPAWCGGAQE